MSTAGVGDCIGGTISGLPGASALAEYRSESHDCLDLGGAVVSGGLPAGGLQDGIDAGVVPGGPNRAFDAADAELAAELLAEAELAANFLPPLEELLSKDLSTSAKIADWDVHGPGGTILPWPRCSLPEIGGSAHAGSGRSLASPRGAEVVEMYTQTEQAWPLAAFAEQIESMQAATPATCVPDNSPCDSSSTGWPLDGRLTPRMAAVLPLDSNECLLPASTLQLSPTGSHLARNGSGGDSTTSTLLDERLDEIRSRLQHHVRAKLSMQGEADVAATWADGGSPLADLKDIGASEPRSMLDVLRGLRTEAPERSGLKSEANADSHKSISPGLASLQSARLALKNALLTNSKLGSLKCASVDLLVSGGKAHF